MLLCMQRNADAGVVGGAFFFSARSVKFSVIASAAGVEVSYSSSIVRLIS